MPPPEKVGPWGPLLAQPEKWPLVGKKRPLAENGSPVMLFTYETIFCRSPGELVDVFLTTRGDPPPKMIVLDDGRPARRNKAAEMGGFDATPGNWPKECDALGVHPSQAKEAQADARKAGITGINFKECGICEIRDRKARSRYLKHRQMFDKDGCYGD